MPAGLLGRILDLRGYARAKARYDASDDQLTLSGPYIDVIRKNDFGGAQKEIDERQADSRR